MTKEEIKDIPEIVDFMLDRSVIADSREKLYNRLEEVCSLSIQALEQESILEKIRAEIEALSNANPSYWHSGDMVDRDDVLEIIDKYMAEREDNDVSSN